MLYGWLNNFINEDGELDGEADTAMVDRGFAMDSIAEMKED